MNIGIWILVVGLALVVGGVSGLWLKQLLGRRQLSRARQASEDILAQAETQAKEALLQAKEEGLKLRAAAETETRERRQELHRQERRLTHKEENLERRLEAIERRDNLLATREKENANLRQQIEETKKQELQKLELVSGMAKEEAKSHLLQMLEAEVKEEASRRAKQWEAEVRQGAEGKAKALLAEALQRYASDVVAETTTSAVPIPSDEMKGRLIGREGRNIRALEQATGVELIIDDTPEVVTLSSFDPVRREVARIALNKLMQDGRIHPARIEEMVERVAREVEVEIQRRGEEAAAKVGIANLHPELIKLLGRLHYRTSYGQNVLTHSLEVAHMAGILASEIGANVEIVKRGGLLHDIGKAVDHQMEGTHTQIGARLAEQWEKSPQVIEAIASHHGDTEFPSVECFLVSAADALSGGRPGARGEALEEYLKRLRELESIATSFPGVEKAFAIQAGRELRVMVKPEAIDEITAMRLARDIAKKIEENLQYPGQIKVILIRETRVTEYAK